MNTHRSGNEGQWKVIPPEEQNYFQRVADRTNGILTPANAISIAGACLVLSGIRNLGRDENTLMGITKIGIGRIADIVDGTVAEKTGTKSPTGEAVDAVADKVVMAEALRVMAEKDVIPRPTASLLFAQNFASALCSVTAKCRGSDLHSSEDGKKATFGQWTSLGLYTLSSIARKNGGPRTAHNLEGAGHISTVTNTILGVSALSGYFRDAFLSKSKQQGRK